MLPEIIYLPCAERQRDIYLVEPLIATKRCDVDSVYAICREVVDLIPKLERRRKKCKMGEGGIDIYEATYTKKHNGYYSQRDFSVGDFTFSISQETAEKYLPRHIRQYPFPGTYAYH